eukprot:7385492-Prymnesium_polylepis.3
MGQAAPGATGALYANYAAAPPPQQPHHIAPVQPCRAARRVTSRWGSVCTARVVCEEFLDLPTAVARLCVIRRDSLCAPHLVLPFPGGSLPPLSDVGGYAHVYHASSGPDAPMSAGSKTKETISGSGVAARGGAGGAYTVSTTALRE